MYGIFGILNNDESNDLKDLNLLSDSMITEVLMTRNS